MLLGPGFDGAITPGQGVRARHALCESASAEIASVFVVFVAPRSRH